MNDPSNPKDLPNGLAWWADIVGFRFTVGCLTVLLLILILLFLRG